MNALTPREAKEHRRPALERASKIRYGMRTYIDTLGLIHQAWAERDDVRLGYPSWEAYYNTEFSEERVRLSPEMRDKAITELRIAGMSQREIAVSTGLSAATVNRHLNRVADETDILEGDLLPPAESPLVDAMKQAIGDASDRAQDHRVATPVRTDPEPSLNAGVDTSGGSAPAQDSIEEGDHRAYAPGEADAPASAADTTGHDVSADPGSVPPTGPGSPDLPVVSGEESGSVGFQSPGPTDPDLDEWRESFSIGLSEARTVMRSSPEHVAFYATDDQLQDLNRLVTDLGRYADDVARALDALEPA